MFDLVLIDIIGVVPVYIKISIKFVQTLDIIMPLKARGNVQFCFLQKIWIIWEPNN
jgi:hypothetical protein